MHRRLTQLHQSLFVLGAEIFGRFQPHMLHRIGIDLRPDDRLNGVEQFLIAQHAEDRRAGPVGRIGFDIGLRQGKVEILGVNLAALFVHFDQALTKGQIRIGG